LNVSRVSFVLRAASEFISHNISRPNVSSHRFLGICWQFIAGKLRHSQSQPAFGQPAFGVINPPLGSDLAI
jgi:hypothetical protein